MIDAIIAIQYFFKVHDIPGKIPSMSFSVALKVTKKSTA